MQQLHMLVYRVGTGLERSKGAGLVRHSENGRECGTSRVLQYHI